MAARSGGLWKKGQKVEIYKKDQDKWIPTQIYDIRDVGGQKVYTVKHIHEESTQIHQKDVESLMRLPKLKTDDNNVKKLLLNLSEQISKQLPITRQIEMLTNNAQRIDTQNQVTWRGLIEAVNQELYPKMATAFGMSVDELLENKTLNLTTFDDKSVDNVIRVLKIKKPALLNKEIDYIKELVKRTVQYNADLKKLNNSDSDSNSNPNLSQKLHEQSDRNNKNGSFFRYKEFNDTPHLDPNADLIPNPKWKGLTANLVVDIYGIFKAMKYGAFQRENYSKIDFLRDIESAESKILGDDAVSSLVEEIDIESAVSFHPQYVIKDDLFETVNPLLAMSLVLNKLELEQIGNGIKIKCVVVPTLITSIYDEQKEYESNIGNISYYLQRARPHHMTTIPVSVATKDIPKTAETLKQIVDTALLGSNASSSTTIFIVFDRNVYDTSPSTVSVHLFAIDAKSVHCLSNLNRNYFVGLEMVINAPRSVQCWLRFGMNKRIRFFPELLVWIIPSLFGRSATLKPYNFWCKLYGDDYKHRWSVSLKDDILAKFHHILTGNVLCSVNYHRSEVAVTKQVQVDGLRDHLQRTLDTVLMEKVEAMVSEQRYDSDAVVEDVMAMVMEREGTHGIESNICRYLNGPKSNGFHQLKHGVMKYLKIRCNSNQKRQITDCPLIENVIQNLIRFEQFGLKIDASNLFEFSLSPLVKGLDHLYRVHEYGLTAGPNRRSVRNHVLQRVQCHLGADCPVVQQHGDRKRENEWRRADRPKEPKQQDGGDRLAVNQEIETQCEALSDALCAAHSYLLHDNDELYRLRLAAAELRFATEVIEDGTKQKKHDTKSHDDNKKNEGTDKDPLSINYGESVLEWLPFGASPLFESLREELIYNEDSTLDHNLLDRMTVQCAAAIEDTDYTLMEALGLKTYADATAFQSELRKAHWKGMVMKMKRAYFHWAMTLYEAHLYHSKPIGAVSGKPRGVYHGLNRLFTMSKELPIYLGPFSVSTQKTVARQFSNEQGLLFTIAPSYVNPFKFSVGIDMITFSSFKNEAEVLFNNQPIPIKQTETFGDAMERLVDHFMFSLKNRKTRIIDIAAFYNKLGVDWNEEWIPFILKHKLLFQTTQCHLLKVIDRLFAELRITDHRLVEPIVDMQHDGKPYIVFLVEVLNVKHLLPYYRVMTSSFIIERHCYEINCSLVKWKPNNKMNHKLGVTQMDESYFDDAHYHINGQPTSRNAYFWPDTIRAVTVRHSRFFGDRLIAVEDKGTASKCPHDFGALLKVDAYSNGSIFVDDVPSPDHHFQIAQEVICNDDSKGKVNRITNDAVCIKITKNSIHTFRWFHRETYPVSLRLNLRSQSSLANYRFVAMEGQDDHSQRLATSRSRRPKMKFNNISEFTISYRSSVSALGVYVRRQRGYGSDQKWGRIATIKYPRDEPIPLSSNSIDAIVSTEKLMENLKKHCFEITKQAAFLKICGLKLEQCSEWTSLITGHQLMFEVSHYRRKLVIERLIVELKLWSPEWIHCILQQTRDEKPMLQWLVEDRNVAKLHDHYRVYRSFDVQSSRLLNRRWVSLNENTKMFGKPGFGQPDDGCFENTEYKADGVAFDRNQHVMGSNVSELTAININLFGDEPIVLQKFDMKNEDDYFTDDFVDCLRFDGKFVFLNHIPSSTYPFCVGQEVQCCDGSVGIISRTTADAVCVKFKNTNMVSFRWFNRTEIPMQLLLTFRYREELQKYSFTVTTGRKDEEFINKQKHHQFSNIESFEISCESMKLKSEHVICIYAKPTNGKYQWIHIKSIDQSMQSLVEYRSTSQVETHGNFSDAIHRLFCSLKQSHTEIKNDYGVLRRCGLEMEQFNQWMPKIATHPLLFEITAHRRMLVIERLISEVNLLNIDLLSRIIPKTYNKKFMLEWLVEERKIKQLYDHYRAWTSGFKCVYRSNLLDRTWLKFQVNTKMNEKADFEDAEDECFRKTKYIMNEEVYPLDTPKTALCVTGIPSQVCRNETLFGDHSIATHLMRYNFNIKNITSVRDKVPGDHTAWFQKIMETTKSQQLKLMISKHRGHYSGCSPHNLLENGKSKHYDNDGKGPIGEDWNIFERMSNNGIPTGIIILNRYGEPSLKEMKIFGSADNVMFEEWLHIQDILCRDDMPQHFELDPTSVYFAWKRGFRYFRLCSMKNYGSRYIAFYEFKIHGVIIRDSAASASTRNFANFIDAININKDCKITADLNYENLKKSIFEIETDDGWVEGMVSRESKAGLCVKWRNSCDMTCYRWISTHDIPTKLRLDITHRQDLSKHIFSVVAGHDDVESLLPAHTEITFDENERFDINLNRAVAYSCTPDTVYVLAKPEKENFDFELIKKIQCDHQAYCKFAVDGAFLVDKNLVFEFEGKFEALATSETIISETGCIDISRGRLNEHSEGKEAALNYKEYFGVSNADKAHICLISGGDVVNKGTLLCGVADEAKVSGGVVYIDSDGVFENKGIIDCGENGFVHIRCLEFKNDGQITPTPKVTYKDTKTDRNMLKQLMAKGGSKSIELEVSSHRGHYGSKDPKNLLDEGTSYYDGDGHGAAGEDWMIFRTMSKKRIFPTGIVIRNNDDKYGLKTVNIEGSSDGIRFDEWVQFTNISNADREELQMFVVDPTTGYFAWERAYTYFKLNLLENHGGRYNQFREFRINGIEEK